MRKMLLIGASVGAIAAASPSNAQSNGEQQADASYDIVVTAQRRAERLQDVPITIQNLSAEQLSNANIRALSDIPKITPSLRFDNQGPFVQPTIRGIGTAIVSSGSGSNVGIYVDGFYLPNPIASDFQLLSVENIQVLKGPQGTLFGRNTTGGAILVTTAKPSQEARAELSASYGSFDALRVEGYATAGLSDTLAMDISAQYSRGDGFIRNIVTGSKTDGRYKKWSVRGGLKFDPTDTISFLLRYQHQETDDPYSQLNGNYVLNGLPTSSSAFFPGGIVATRPGETSITDKVLAITNNDTVQFTATFDFDFATLTSYTQYRDERSVFQQSFSAGTPNIIVGNVPIHDRTFSQELLLSSHPGGSLQWTAGAFYFTYKDRFRASLSPLGAPFFQVAGSDSDTRTLAFFLDGTYRVTDKLFLTLGARYSRDEIKNPYYEALGASGIFKTFGPDRKSDRVTPRVVLRYAIDPDTSVYASFTRGYKAGIYNLGGQSTDFISPEKIDAYELGFKHASRKLSFELAGFYYGYKDLQVSSYGLVNGAPVGIVKNAAAARIYGLEAQLRYEVFDGFQLNASGAYLDAQYEHFFGNPIYVSCFAAARPAACTPNPGDIPPSLVVVPAVDTPGFAMQRAPKFTAAVGASYGFDLAGGHVGLSGNLYYSSKFYFDAGQQLLQSGYATLGLRAEWTDPSERLTLAVFGDNVTDKRYLTQAILQNFAAPVSWSAPATVGVEVRVRFP